jgi:hypothetical protein
VCRPKVSGLMLDLKAAAVTEDTAGVFVFQRVAYVVPRFLAGHRRLMAALDLCADVNRVSRQVGNVPMSDIDYGWQLSQRGS